MSVALLIDYPHDKARDRYIPVSCEAPFWRDWYPVIEKEGYIWLPAMGGDLVIDADNFFEVMNELCLFLAAVLRHYAPDSAPGQHLTERLTRVINTLEEIDGAELSRGEVEIWIG